MNICISQKIALRSRSITLARGAILLCGRNRVNKWNNLSDQEKDESFLSISRKDGASLFLTRQQSAIVYSALHDRMKLLTEKIEKERVQKHTEKSPYSLWRLIISDPELFGLSTEIFAQDFECVCDRSHAERLTGGVEQTKLPITSSLI
ncbi:MAG: hypothetical protein C0507_14020 [Cyanobacteria bacterium PR.3.49]|nr:hypothetical protein [Cyanobacteria bacterium PR.3.49]